MEYAIEATSPGVLSASIEGDGTPAMLDVLINRGLTRNGGGIEGCLSHGNKQASATVSAGMYSVIVTTPDRSEGGAYRLRVDLQPSDAWYARPIARGVTLKTRIYANLNGARESAALLEVNLADPDVVVKPLARAGSCTKPSRLAKEANAVAAINAGPFEGTSCSSLSLLKIDGGVLSRNAANRTVLGIDRAKRPAFQRIAANQEWPDAVQAVGGLPRIATAGRVDLHTLEEGSTAAFEQGRNGRTAVGISAQGGLLFGVVNGRTRAGAGMSLRELAAWMIDSGASDAMNLDGGGSSTLWAFNEPGDGIVNRPSDPGGERPVSAAVGVFAKKLDLPAIWLTRPKPARIMVGEEWSFEAIVADPEAQPISFRVDRTSADGVLAVRDRGDGTARFSFVPTARDAERSPINLTLFADVRTSSTATVGATITVIQRPSSDGGVRRDGGPGSDGGPDPGSEDPADQNSTKSGCSCSTAEPRHGATSPSALWLIVLFAIGVRRLRPLTGQRDAARWPAMRKAVSPRIVLLLIFLTVPRSARAQDPAAMGPLQVGTETYEFGSFTPPAYPHPIELRGQIKYPAALDGGPYPVALLLHGRHSTCYQGTAPFAEWPCAAGHLPIDSFRGYDYLGDILASNGVITISVSVNGINAYDDTISDAGMALRAEVLQRHLDQWRTWSTTGGFPSNPSKFLGKVDLARVATMGHSRGGEGVVTHYNLNRSRGSPYGILGVIPLAPVNFFRPNTGDAALMVVAPGCDGDVNDLQGVHYFDDVRYNGATKPRYTIHVLGGNHNYFNTMWTDGIGPSMHAADDWLYDPGLAQDPYCSFTQAGNGRLSAAQQRAIGAAYMAAFFRTVINGEDFSGFLTGDAGVPPSAYFVNRPVYAWYHAPDAKRRDISRPATAADLNMNYVGGMITNSNLNPIDLCGGEAPQQRFCLTKPQGFGDAQFFTWQPHQTPAAFAMNTRGLSLERFAWGNAGPGRISHAIPPSFQDVSAFDAIQLRGAVSFQSPANIRGASQDMTITLEDGTNSASTTVSLASSSGLLYYPPGGFFPHLMLNTIRIPLTNFSGVDLTSVRTVRFDFDQSASGALMISDVAFASGP